MNDRRSSRGRRRFWLGGCIRWANNSRGLPHSAVKEGNSKSDDNDRSERADRRIKPLATRPICRAGAESSKRNLESPGWSRHPRHDDSGRRLRQLGVLDQDYAVELLNKLCETGGISRSDEQEKGTRLRKAGGEFFPSRTLEDLVVDQRIRSARHHVEVPGAFDFVTDLVERHAVEKAVGDSRRVLVLDQGAEWRDIADQISDDGPPMRGFSACDSQSDVDCGQWIAGYNR